MARFLGIFLFLPVFDLLLLLRLRHVLGSGTTLFAVLASALAGIAIARVTGARELRAWQTAVVTGRPIDRSVLESLLIWLGCVGLLVPGFVSDVLGVLLLMGSVRRRIAARLTQRVQQAMQRGNLHVRMDDRAVVYHHAAYQAAAQAAAYGSAAHSRVQREDDIIDVEGETVAESSAGSSRKLPEAPR